MRQLKFALCLAAPCTLLLATAVAGQGGPPKGPASAAPAPSKLPPGPGHDTMTRVCSGCHSPEIAAQQRLSEQGWQEMVDTMAARGAPGSEADFAEITAYLAKNFPDKPVK